MEWISKCSFCELELPNAIRQPENLPLGIVCDKCADKHFIHWVKGEILWITNQKWIENLAATLEETQET